MPRAARKPLTYAEYLAVERDTGIRHEWRRGEIVAMAGGTLVHARLATRIVGELHRRLEGGPCQPYNSDARARIPAEDVSTYPDVAVVCGEVERDAVDAEAITNPSVVFEVLSDSTELYDRTEKFGYYKMLPSLREYVLVSQHGREIEHWRRRPDGTWIVQTLDNDGVLSLRSIRVRIPVAQIYKTVPVSPRKLRLRTEGAG